MTQQIFRAFLEFGEDIGKVEVLANWRCPGCRAPRPRVLEDEELAASLRISAVPAMVLSSPGNSFAPAVLISGARPYEVIADAVREVAA